MTTSPRLSFKGYSIATALGKNMGVIKGIIAIISGIQVVSGFDWKTFLLTLGAALAGLAVKLLVDALDFFFSEVEVQ